MDLIDSSLGNESTPSPGKGSDKKRGSGISVNTDDYGVGVEKDQATRAVDNFFQPYK
jgi:hypothetical protein